MSKGIAILGCIVEITVLFYNSLALSSGISFSFSRNEELELGSEIVVEVIVGKVDETTGCIRLIVIIGELVDEVDLKEFTILRSSETIVCL